jgi:hypothetical protein
LFLWNGSGCADHVKADDSEASGAKSAAPANSASALLLDHLHINEAHNEDSEPKFFNRGGGHGIHQ